MFDFGYSELLLIAVVALLVIGPKDLPKAMRVVGHWMGKGRAMARHMRSGFDEMMRQAEMEEMEKQWKAHNEAIMRATPAASDLPAESEPAPAPLEDTPAPGDPLSEQRHP